MTENVEVVQKNFESTLLESVEATGGWTHIKLFPHTEICWSNGDIDRFIEKKCRS